MKTKTKSLRRNVNVLRDSKNTQQRDLNSISSLLLPTKYPEWSKGTLRHRSKSEARSQLALKLACLRAERKRAPQCRVPRPTKEDFDTLFEYAFGAGRSDAQLITAFYLRYQDCPAVIEQLDKLVGLAVVRGDTEFLREMAKARDEQERSPWGRNMWRAYLMARKVCGKPGMTVSSLGKLIDPGAKNSGERASADQTARRALTDTGMLIPDKRGFKKGAKRKPREKKEKPTWLL